MTDLGTAQQQFILHWGEMSSRWGINRSMAQIHALLYLSSRPLDAEEIHTTLSLARSNVSTSLRELKAWGLVRVVHQLGDRRDYYESTKDVWEMFRTILERRKRSEIDPTIRMLRGELDRAESEDADTFARERMGEMLALLEGISTWYEQMSRLPTSAQRKILEMGDRIRRLAG